MSEPQRRRLLLTDLDSPDQRAALPGPHQQWLRQPALGQLSAVVRMGVLMGGALAVTHNQLFDGRFFLALGAHGFADLVGAPVVGAWPLELFTRGATTLGDGLLELFVTEPEPEAPLNGFLFSALEPDEADVVRQRLPQWTVADLQRLVEERGTAEGCAAMLEQAGASADRAQFLAERWRGWLSVDGSVEVLQAKDWRLSNHVGLADPESARRALGARHLDAAVPVVDELLDAKNRSAAFGVLRALRAERSGSAQDLEAAAVLEGWVTAWYHRAQAASTGSDLLSSITDGRPPGQRWDDRHLLTIEPELVRELADMPAEAFALLRYQTRATTEGWWAADKRSRRVSQRRLAFAMSEQTETADPHRLWWSALAKMVLLVMALGIVELGQTGWHRLVIVLGAVVLTLSPELWESRRLWGSRLDELVNLSRA